LKGKYALAQQYETAFIKVFKELQIEEKTKDFKESPTQLSMKESYQKVKNLLTIPLISSIILSMATQYNISEVLSSRDTQNTNLFTRAFDFLLNAFFVFSTQIKNMFSQLATSFEVAFFMEL